MGWWYEVRGTAERNRFVTRFDRLRRALGWRRVRVLGRMTPLGAGGWRVDEYHWEWRRWRPWWAMWRRRP